MLTSQDVIPEENEKEYIATLETRLWDKSHGDLKGRRDRSPPSPVPTVTVEVRLWEEIHSPPRSSLVPCLLPVCVA